MESSFGSSSGGRMRILEVSIQSASFSKDVKINHSGEIYAKLWIKGSDERRKLKTGNLLLASQGLPAPNNLSAGATTNSITRRDHEFVFAVKPSFFVVNNNTSSSSVCFEIYRTRKHLMIRDKLLGRGECDVVLDSLDNDQTFKTAADHHQDNGYKEDAKYDSEDDNYHNATIFDDRADDDEGSGKIKSTTTTSSKSEVIMPPPSALPEMKGFGRVKVGKDSEQVMELGVEMVVWKGYVGRIGKCRFSMAMEKNEFMGLAKEPFQASRKRSTSRFAMCCGKIST